MATLEPHADKAVRDAVDAFMEGRLVPEFLGETVFETKNSRYRLVDGVVIVGPDPSLVGAELVGWLYESGRRCLVESAWQPGSRAVLVDRREGRNIIVTSTTRLLHLEDSTSSSRAGALGSRASRASRSGEPPQRSHSDFVSWHPPPKPAGDSVMAPRAAIIAATPEPPKVAPVAPVASVAQSPRPDVFAVAPTLPPAAGADPPRRPGVHPPPRPIASWPTAPPSPAPPPPILRPLPVPVPPPRRDSTPQMAAVAAPPPPAPSPVAPDAPWELGSNEIELDAESVEPETLQRPGVGEPPSTFAALPTFGAPPGHHWAPPDGEAHDEADSMGAIPIELVRPARAAVAAGEAAAHALPADEGAAPPPPDAFLLVKRTGPPSR